MLLVSMLGLAGKNLLEGFDHWYSPVLSFIDVKLQILSGKIVDFRFLSKS